MTNANQNSSKTVQAQDIEKESKEKGHQTQPKTREGTTSFLAAFSSQWSDPSAAGPRCLLPQRWRGRKTEPMEIGKLIGRKQVVMRSRNKGEEEEDEACDEEWRQRLRQRLWDLARAKEEKMGGEEANGEVRQRRPSWVGEDGHSGGFRQLGQGQEASVTGRKKEQRGGQEKGSGRRDHGDEEGIAEGEQRQMIGNGSRGKGRVRRRGEGDDKEIDEDGEKGEVVVTKEGRGECERWRDRVAASPGRKTTMLAMEEAVATRKERRAGEVGRRGRKAREDFGKRRRYFFTFYFYFILFHYIFI